MQATSDIYWICEGCGSRVTEEGAKCPLAEKGDCTKPKLRMECAASPNFPHLNEKWWREQKKKEKDKK